jgi:hypothetical protein
MHNGEKGIWEKWTLFDESTRVPLLISHPKSPFQGSHYKSPVELIDIYPTVLDLVQAPYDKHKVCRSSDICRPLQGKSLARIVLGDKMMSKIIDFYNTQDIRLDRKSKKEPFKFESRNYSESGDFAISQMWVCARKEDVKKELQIRKTNKKRKGLDEIVSRLSSTWYLSQNNTVYVSVYNIESLILGFSVVMKTIRNERTNLV